MGRLRTVVSVAVLLVVGATVGVAASDAWEYNYPNAETGTAAPGTPSNGNEPGATVPPAANTQAEEEEAHRLNKEAEEQAKEKAEREASTAPCVVPALHGKSLAQARTMLSAAQG